MMIAFPSFAAIFTPYRDTYEHSFENRSPAFSLLDLPSGQISIATSSPDRYDSTEAHTGMSRNPKYLQEPLFQEFKQDVCYVCYGRIKKDEERVNIGHNTWRHKKCKPGGRAWQKSRVGREHSMSQLFPQEDPT
jgi:hypothetical protein